MRVKTVRNVFVDSEVNTIGNGEKTKINFPPDAFSITAKERMRLTLTTFEMRRNFYNINQTNNTFYIFSPLNSTYRECVIAPGNYNDYATLALAIQSALVGVYIGSTCTFNQINRKFTLTLGPAVTAYDPASYIVCFQCKGTNTQATNVSDAGYFSDVHEILGGIPTRDGWLVDRPENAFGPNSTGGVTPNISPYLGSLSTLEAVYVRTTIHSSNYQTYGFEKQQPNQSGGLTPTQIFARIPVTSGDLIVYEDTNDLFSMYLNQTQLSQCEFSITDDKGRFLPEINTGQAEIGMLSFKMSLRWEVLEDDYPSDERKLRLENVAQRYENRQVMN